MMKYVWLLPLGMLLVAGCSSMNVSLGGELGGANVGASVDPLNKNVNVNAGKTFKVGDVETTVNSSTDGSGVSTDTEIEYEEEEE